jgi:AbrB family looped-hinge helix DNA binding protein
MKEAAIPRMYGAVTVGERGQIVIPAQARKTFRIKAGDKLVVYARPRGAIGLMPAESLSRFLEQDTDTRTHVQNRRALT